MANKNSILASIAVFSELCDTSSSIQKILNEFIISVFSIEKLTSINSQEAKIKIKQHFDLDVPEAIVRSSLNGLVGKLLKRDYGQYYLTKEITGHLDLQDQIERKRKTQMEIEADLINYYELTKNKSTSEFEKANIIKYFSSYLLLDNLNIPEEFSTIISSFIVHRSPDAEFVAELQHIKEGLVLVSGLKYTQDLNSVGQWTEEMTIMLDTEILFSMYGYNGEIYKQLFDDFFSLVNEINYTSKNKNGRALIKLKFFPEVQEEMDHFFRMAEKIVRRQENAKPHNTAMTSICNGCATTSELLKRKADFDSAIKTRGIEVLPDIDYYSKPEFVVEAQEIILKYEQNHDEHDIQYGLKSFTKINYLRKGVNRIQFEKCRFILLTGKYTLLTLSKDIEVKNELKDIPFATDIVFITSRIWYKLNKGFSKDNKVPASFDAVVKARIVLASQIRKSIVNQYEKLQVDLATNKISEAQAQDWYYNLRNKSKKPEDITIDELQDTVDFIFENDLDKYLREKSSLELRTSVQEMQIKELRKFRFNTLNQRKGNRKTLVRILSTISFVGFVLILISIPALVLILIYKLKTEADSPLGIAGLIISIIIELIGIWKFSKTVIRYFRRRFARWYGNMARRIN